LITREEPDDDGDAGATASVAAGALTSCPGDGGGGGTSGRGAAAGALTDGVGRVANGEEKAAVGGAAGVGRVANGAAAPPARLVTGVACRGVIAGLVSGVVAPTEIRTIAPHTLQRARTPFGGTLEGSTRNTDRQS